MRNFIEIINKPGDIIDVGCADSNVVTSINYAISIDARKRIRVVRDWQWLDIDICEDKLYYLIQNELLPSLIYCGEIVYDSAFPLSCGRRARTSFLKKFHSHYSIFETQNTHYILNCNGERKTVKAEIIFNI